MRTLTELKPLIKDAIWELKDRNGIITVKNVYDIANGAIEFSELPVILQYMESIKEKFLHTNMHGYLELHPIKQATVKDLVSRC